MPKEVIDAIMARRNPRTGRNYTRDEAEAIYYSAKHRHNDTAKGRHTHICTKCNQRLTEKTRKGHASLLGHGEYIKRRNASA